MTADPIAWGVAVYLDDEPGSPASTSWAEVLLELDAGQDAEPLAVVSGLDGEVFLRLRPLRVRLDRDVLTVVGVLSGGDGEASEAVVTVCARPAEARRAERPPPWPPVQGLPPEIADQLDWSLLPGLLTEAIRAQPAEVQAQLADREGITALPFDLEGCATFIAGDVALLRLHWQALLPQPPRAA